MGTDQSLHQAINVLFEDLSVAHVLGDVSVVLLDLHEVGHGLALRVLLTGDDTGLTGDLVDDADGFRNNSHSFGALLGHQIAAIKASHDAEDSELDEHEAAWKMLQRYAFEKEEK